MADPVLESSLASHRAGRFADAEEGYRRCLRSGIEEAAFPLSVVLLQQQRYAEAAGVLEPLAATKPGDAQVATNLSIALRNSGRADAALHAARRAVDASPGNAGALNALGLAALELGRYEEALAAFDGGLRLAPNEPALELHRGKCLHQLGRLAAALAAFQHVVARAPGLVEGWRSLGTVQMKSGLIPAALESRARALALAPGDHEVALEHAIALLHAGSAAAAVQRLDALLKAQPEHVPGWTWLGRAHLKHGDLAAARTAFERAGSLDPADPVIAHYRVSLGGVLPDDVESDYIRVLFDDFADHFESILVDRLAYDTPRKLVRFLQDAGVRETATVLDLGCGTGLMAAALAGAGCRIDGVDLSPRMLEQARAKGLYRELHVAEMLQFLRAATAQWELIVAADVFIYVADLRPVFEAVRERLAPGGRLAFSIETSSAEQTELPPETGRYRHSPQRLAEALAAAGFERIRREAVVLRMESGVPVAGELLLAARP